MNDLCPKCESDKVKSVHRDVGFKEGAEYHLIIMRCKNCGWEGDYGDLLPGWVSLFNEKGEDNV
jgi:RNase P subunit RPR2